MPREIKLTHGSLYDLDGVVQNIIEDVKRMQGQELTTLPTNPIHRIFGIHATDAYSRYYVWDIPSNIDVCLFVARDWKIISQSHIKALHFDEPVLDSKHLRVIEFGGYGKIQITERLRTDDDAYYFNLSKYTQEMVFGPQEWRLEVHKYIKLQKEKQLK